MTSRGFSSHSTVSMKPCTKTTAVKPWKYRTVCTRDRNAKMQKVKKLRATFAQPDVLALQEVHGTSGEIEGALFEQAFHSEVFEARDWTATLEGQHF